MKKVIIQTREGDVIDVAPVIRETKTMVIAGHGREQYRLKKPFVARGVRGEYPYSTPKEIAKAEKIMADQKARRAAEKKEREKRIAKAKADPRYELLRRFGDGADFEPWRELTLEQLQTIANIFDSVKK